MQNTFDIPNSQARIEAHKLFKELVAEAKLTTQERISYYLQLAEHYIRVGLDLKPSDSYALALKNVS